MVHSRTRLVASDSSSVPSGAAPSFALPLATSSPKRLVAGPLPRSAFRSSREKLTLRLSAPQRGGSMVTVPRATTSPISPLRSASTAMLESRPSMRSVPVTSPRGVSEGKPRRIPSNDSGSSCTSMPTPSSLPRESSRTMPVSALTGRSPSRWRAVPRKVAFRIGPSSVPTATSRPGTTTAGASRSMVPRSRSESRMRKFSK